MATNFLKLFSIGSDGVAFMVGASGVGKMYTWSVEGATGSGLLVGNGFKTSSWGFSTVSFPLPSSKQALTGCPIYAQSHLSSHLFSCSNCLPQ